MPLPPPDGCVVLTVLCLGVRDTPTGDMRCVFENPVLEREAVVYRFERSLGRSPCKGERTSLSGFSAQ